MWLPGKSCVCVRLTSVGLVVIGFLAGRRHWTLERAWKGKWQPPVHRRLSSTGQRARSFCIMPDERLVLVAQEGYDGQDVGTVMTVDIGTDTVLWRLSEVRLHNS